MVASEGTRPEAVTLARVDTVARFSESKAKRTTGIKKMVQRLTAAGNTNVKHTEFPDAKHSAANAAVFSSVELVDWMLGFSRTQ